MGVDIIGTGKSYSWNGWRQLFELGQEYGWKPQGTERPTDHSGDWAEGYFSNDFQIVTREDAWLWSNAIRKAIAAKQSSPRPLKQAVPPWVYDDDSEFRWLEEFADLASRRELVLG